MKKFWNWIKNSDDTRILRLEGPIDEESFWGDEITPQMFRDELESGEGDVTVWINSPGGNVFAAAEIYTMLKDYKGSITVKIDAIAASAASVVAMAGDTVQMSPVAMLMIHDPSTVAMGNTKDMEKAIEVLTEVKESIINAYVAFINEDTYSGLTLDDERIRQAIIEFRPRLVVIDPIQAYLGSDSDLQIAGRARKLMHRLGMWASVYDCAIVLIGHLNKKEGTKGLYRSLGSIDVVAAARSVLQVERDSENTDIRIVRQIKNSLAPSDGEIRFSITAEAGFEWLECEVTPDPSAEPGMPDFESKSEKAAYLIHLWV